MGQSTNGQIAFGFIFEEGYKFPWDAEEYEGDHKDWWRRVNGYEPPFQPYADTKTGYAEGFSKDDARISEYFSHRREWEKSNPLPFEVVNYCSGDYPEYMLAIAGSLKEAYRGFPVAFDPKELSVSVGSILKFMEFIAKHGIEYTGDPKWYLTSYWG